MMCVTVGERACADLWGGSILCGDFAIKLIDEPFVSDTDDKEEWAL